MGSYTILCIFTYVVSLLISCYLCQSVNVMTSLDNNEHKDKKGTIRIAGPWHSDSALDRNVDAGEDSYVKKIISSNEGINFNKDIAEAGEMFDVNGIEDFYDKNAMITYEINGHEVPVHIKPKLTPQSKSLFPEYAKDSPASMGLARGVRLREHLRKNGNINLSDSPNYKISPSTKLNSGRTSLLNSIQSFTKPKQNFWESPGTNTGSKYFHSHIPSGVEHTRIKGMQHAFPEALINGNHQSQLKYSPRGQLNSDDIGLKNYKEPKYEKVDIRKFMKDNGGVKKSNREELLFQNLETLHNNLEKDKEMNEAGMKSVTGDEVEPRKAKAKSRILNLLSELTDKLKGMESIVSGNREKKVVSTERGVNLNRQNTMESSHDYPDEKQPVENREVASMNQDEHRDIPESEIEQLEKQVRERMALLSELNSNKIITGQTDFNENSELKDSSHGPENLLHGGEESAREHGNNRDKSLLMKTFHKISGDEISEENHAMEENKHQSELIEKFKEHNKPFVMNTKAIDFNPEEANNDEEPEVNEINAEGEEEVTTSKSHRLKQHFRNHKNTNEEDPSSRHTLLNFRKKNRQSDDNDETENHVQDDDEDDYDDGDDQRRRRRRHKTHHHRHQYRNEEEDDADDDVSTAKHHRQYHQPEREDDDKSDATESKTITPDDHHFSSVENDKDDVENSKMYAVEEDLADADEKNSGISRERSFRPQRVRGKEDKTEYPDYNDVKDAAIFEANLLRKRFHAKPVQWSDKLSDSAQQQAEALAKIIDINPKTLNTYRVPGEDVALVNIDSTNVGKDAPEVWARGSKFYDFRSPQITSKNNDFAQLMWKSSNEFGLGVARSKLGNNWIVTSMFDTPVIDRYKDLKLNLESDIPIEDPYSDIVG